MSDGPSRDLPQGWNAVRLGDLLFGIEAGKSFRCEPRVAHGDEWGVVKVSAMTWGQFDETENKVVAPERVHADNEIRSGDILLSRSNTADLVGASVLVGACRPRLLLSDKSLRLIYPKSLSERWLQRALSAPDARAQMSRAATGTSDSMRNLSQDKLYALQLLLPPAREQERIVERTDELLSDLDAGVAALERVRAKLKHYRAAVLKAAVEGALTAEWRREHPATETADALLTRILAERRRRWEEAQLAKFAAAGKTPPKDWKAKYRESRTIDAASPSALPQGWIWVSAEQLSWASGYGTSEKCSEANDGLAVLRIPNVVGGGIDLTNLKFARSDYKEPEEELVAVGDLLIVRTNGSRTLIGRGAVVRGSLETPLSFASYLIRLRLVPFVSVLGWVTVLWESPSVRQWIEARAATSAGQHNISLSVLEVMPFPLPPEDEQAAIVEAVEAQLSVIDHLERDLDARLKSAQALRQSILRHAFTGQLVPQDPNDEPASELLKRIAAEREERARLLRAAKQATPKKKAPRRRTQKD